MTKKSMIGTVTRKDGNYFVVESPEAPPHLRILHLIPRQMAGAGVGDRVRLEYDVTPSYGLWNVHEVLS